MLFIDDLVVLALPSPDGERFALMRRDDVAQAAAHCLLADDRHAAFLRMAASIAWVTEAAAREGLAGIGLSGPAIEERIAAARRKAAVMMSGPFVYERITAIGYRNPDGQQVVRRTDVTGRSGQRVFVMRCTVCGHEYGVFGIDADIRRCPQCQDGPPGVPFA